MHILKIPYFPHESWVELIIKEFGIITPPKLKGNSIHFALDNFLGQGSIMAGMLDISMLSKSTLTTIWFFRLHLNTFQHIIFRSLPDYANKYIVIVLCKSDDYIKDVVDNQHTNLGYGGLDIENFGIIHNIHISKNCSISTFALCISKEWLKAHLSKEDEIMHQLLQSMNPIHINTAITTEIRAKLDRILLNRLGNFNDIAQFHADIIEIIRLSFEVYKQTHSQYNQHKLKKRDIESLIRAEEILLKDIKHAPTIKYLSSEAAMSESKFKIAFKKLFGKSVYDYYLHYRLEIAKEMIIENDLAINEIVDRLGYKSVSYFSRLFKEHYGELPSKYRKTLIK